MQHKNCNYQRNNTDTKCPLCEKLEDTTEHVLECEKANMFSLGKENKKGEWEEITEIYRKNKVAVIMFQDQSIIIKGRKK